MESKTIILDSSVWIGYFYTKDAHHARAVEVLNRFKNYQFLIPEIVFYETMIRSYKLLQTMHEIFEIYNFITNHPRMFIVSLSHSLTKKLIFEYLPRISLKYSDFQVLLYVVEYRPELFISFDDRCMREYFKLK